MSANVNKIKKKNKLNVKNVSVSSYCKLYLANNI